MATIYFDKDEYKAGETATITYVDAPRASLAAVRKGGSLIYRKVLTLGGSGSFEYTVPTTLGKYEVVLIVEGMVRALDSMKVVSGVPYVPPPAEGETRELDLGDYEVTWTLSGQDTLKAEIRVTDTGVTCLSVTGGACNSITAPGVLVVAFTVTGYLKSAVAPPTKGYLKVNTAPTGATVTVDGVSCGTTPVTACELSTGSKTVTITKSGYNTETRSVTIAAGQTSDLGTITLTPTGAPTPPDAAKFKLSEIVENHLPEWITGYACAKCSGRYEYKCPAGYKRTECRPEPNGTHGCCARCAVAFVKCEQEGVAPPTKGFLSVNTAPTGASVTVDIVFPCGTTPVTKCELDTGTKTVTITKSGYNTVTRTVTITAGATTNLGTITLTPTAAPPVGIGGWIDESGVTNLTKDHAVYVFYVSAGAVSAAEGKYAKLSPKPSRLDPSLASKDNAIGIFYYSQGAMAAGNGKTGCNY